MVFISFQNHFECYINSRIPVCSVIYVSRLSLLTVLSVPCTLAITFLERADLLALLCVMVPCVLSFCNMMSSDRCGT